MIRSRSKWLSQGERPTKYFLNLKKRNYDVKSVAALFNHQGTLLTSQDDILSFEKDHYTAQHAQLPSVHSPDPFCPPPLPILDDMDRQILNADLSKEELETAMIKMKSVTSPGCDGIRIKLFEHFWHLLGKPLLSSFIFSLQRGTLTPNQRRAVITLILKKE